MSAQHEGMIQKESRRSARPMRINFHFNLIGGGTNMMKRWLVTAAVLGMMLATAGRSHADLVVVPNAYTNVEGNSNNGFPYNIQPFGLTSQRYQQVYSSTQFGSGAMMISQILFRPDAQSGSSFSSTLPNVQIDLSTTSASASALSFNFASNVGADDTVVHSGALSLSSSFTGPSGGPKDFDIVINLSTPFLYDPSKGNLLMDVRNFSGGSTTQFDATTDPSIGRNFTLGSGVNSPTADGVGPGYGLVTEFNFGPVNPIPEPSTLAIAGLGGVGFLVYGWRRRRSPQV
jgi:PEP-CTERM motif